MNRLLYSYLVSLAESKSSRWNWENPHNKSEKEDIYFIMIRKDVNMISTWLWVIKQMQQSQKTAYLLFQFFLQNFLNLSWKWPWADIEGLNKPGIEIQRGQKFIIHLHFKSYWVDFLNLTLKLPCTCVGRSQRTSDSDWARETTL